MPTSPIPLHLSSDLSLTGRSRNAYAQASRGPRPPLVAIRRGVYADRPAWDALPPWKRHLVACVASTIASPSSSRVLVRESAAVVLGIPLIGALPRRVQLALPGAGSGRLSRTSTTYAAPADLPVQEVDGVLVTSPGRTVVDLARGRPFRSGLAAADAVLADGRASLEEMIGLVEQDAGRPGVARARLVLQYADARAESPAESLSRAVMIEHRLPLPDLQHRVYEPDGAFVGRVDFFWEVLGVVGEIDGRIKFTEPMAGSDPAGRAADLLQRDSRLARVMGSPPVHWTWDDAYREAEMLRRLSMAGVEPGLSRPTPPNHV